MNPYFACPITGGREFELVYQAMVRLLTGDQHGAPTGHLAESGVIALETVIDATLQIQKFLNTHKLCL